jgi:hypothetical protein
LRSCIQWPEPLGAALAALIVGTVIAKGFPLKPAALIVRLPGGWKDLPAPGPH